MTGLFFILMLGLEIYLYKYAYIIRIEYKEN